MCPCVYASVHVKLVNVSGHTVSACWSLQKKVCVCNYICTHVRTSVCACLCNVRVCVRVSVCVRNTGALSGVWRPRPEAWRAVL